MRKFYSCSVCQPGEDYCEENFARIVANNAFILHQHTTQKGLYNDIKPGDILILKYNNLFVSYGETVIREETHEAEWNLWARVKKWYFKDSDNKEKGVATYGIQENTLEGSGQMGTVKGLNPMFAMSIIEVINPSTALFEKIMIEKKELNNSAYMNELQALLHYKKQIILHGPPGTGKTWLAKKIAAAMTEPAAAKVQQPDIDSFFTTNKVATTEITARRKELEGYLADFQQKFKKETLSSISLEQYAFGKGDNDSFCWWIEYGLSDLGGYTGQASKFKIYWKRHLETYLKYGFIKNIENDNDAMQLLATELYNVANEQNLQQAATKLGRGLMLKMLHSYYPDKYFPINNENCINNGLKLMGIESSGMTVFEKNMRLQQAFEEKRSKTGADVTNYEFMNFLFSKFDMKGEIKKLETGEVISEGKYKLIQFHPAFTYEDFVRGIVAETNNVGQVEYKVVNKVLADYAQQALDNPSANFVLIIDEINRANLPAVLGELLYALEYRYNEKDPKNTSVESIYALKQDKEDEEGDYTLKLPGNLYIIGTMNTADRSTGHIDYAIRRRFAFVPLPPSEEVIQQNVAETDGLRDKAIQLYRKVAALFNADRLASDFHPEDVQPGHSYFMAASLDELQLKLEFEIKPLLKEYMKDGILLSAVAGETVGQTADIIENLTIQ